MRHRAILSVAALVATLSCNSEQAEHVASKRQGLATTLDPLIRLPGTQPGQVVLEDAKQCVSCHGGYNAQVEPTFNWQGSMMAQAARDPLFWTAMTVAAQDSIWAVGRPNATDLCERCHFPQGWVAGRSDPTNASAFTGGDFDGVHCDACHKLYDPHFETTYNGTREGNDWAGYWDEANHSSSDPTSATAAATTYAADALQAATITYFNGNDFYANNLPLEAGYTEATGGQFYYAATAEKRASFADAGAKHTIHYSRFHKSKYLCGTCHDVSNPALANLAFIDAVPGDGTTVLPSEQAAAHSYYHVERTFSEFMLSAYGRQGGATGIGPFAPTVFSTSQPGNAIASCQDCHMRDVQGAGADKNSAVFRPDDSDEHPKSGQPLHDLTGGNIFISYLLASAITGSANYDATNAQLLNQGAATLTLDMRAGLGIDAAAMLAGVERAKQQLQLAASIDDLVYTGATGAVSFKVQNQTGHKLISGFPEGRRMFVNVRAYNAGALVHEVNPYDATVGTLRGLDLVTSPSSPALSATEQHISQLVYEMNPSSTLTGESKTFHFVLADGRYKDNRIPPRGFDSAAAAQRLVDPVWGGVSAPSYFTAAEYAGGYDDVSLTLPVAADRVEVKLYYQTTSREYIEFLRHQIAGTPSRQTLPASAYVAQTDPFFDQLRAWGETMWQLWDFNKDVPGAAPFEMASAEVGVAGPPPCDPPTPSMVAAVTVDRGENTVQWSDEHASDALVTGYKLYYDQGGKSLLLATLRQITRYVDSGLTDGQTYCYKVVATYADCDSPFSNVVCGTPVRPDGDICTIGDECSSTFCVDGRCCNNACGGGDTDDCQACSTAAFAAVDGVCGDVANGTACLINAANGTCNAGTCDPTPDAGVPDATVDAGPTVDSTVDTVAPDTLAPDSTVDTVAPDTLAPDSTLDTLSPDTIIIVADSTVDTTVVVADSTVDTTTATDSSVDTTTATDSSVDTTTATDSSVDTTTATDSSVDSAAVDATPDSSASDAGVDSGEDDLAAADQPSVEGGVMVDLGGDAAAPKESDGCSCRASGEPNASALMLLILGLFFVWRRRRR